MPSLFAWEGSADLVSQNASCVVDMLKMARANQGTLKRSHEVRQQAFGLGNTRRSREVALLGSWELGVGTRLARVLWYCGNETWPKSQKGLTTSGTIIVARIPIHPPRLASCPSDFNLRVWEMGSAPNAVRSTQYAVSLRSTRAANDPLIPIEIGPSNHAMHCVRVMSWYVYFMSVQKQSRDPG